MPVHHLLVDADGQENLVHGCQGLAVRLAKAVNRVPGRGLGDRISTTRDTSP
jgi:hypothetical protein